MPIALLSSPIPDPYAFPSFPFLSFPMPQLTDIFIPLIETSSSFSFSFSGSFPSCASRQSITQSINLPAYHIAAASGIRFVLLHNNCSPSRHLLPPLCHLITPKRRGAISWYQSVHTLCPTSAHSLHCCKSSGTAH